MSKTLLFFCAFFIFQFTFSQVIAVSGSCTDSEALSNYYQVNGTDSQNGKPKYTGENSITGCSQYTDELTCDSGSNISTFIYYTIEWSGTNWEWVKTTTTGSFCVWLIEECVPTPEPETSNTTREVLASSPADTPTPPCTGWTGDCSPTFSECATLSISNNNFDKQFTYYPNPTNGNFNIKFEAPIDELNISLTNVLGKVIMNKTYNNSQLIELNIDQPSGIYFVKLVSKNGQKANIKLIKN
ncbi:T9SS type A sorting domain-containing protein [Gaetbulibacter sp. PBL-D1]|uniref:T9SS type A sorting domain-containing protein n=1 Tax=Gaetbulibacter sp. PBL-D1 TaxID=3422594 RepID=UPI003D2EDE4C